MEARQVTSVTENIRVINAELSRLWRLETLTRRYKAAYQWQGGTDAEWEERLDLAKITLFEELEK